MKLLHKDLVSAYHTFLIEEYPDLTIEQVNEIVSAPFEHLKEGMKSGDFSVVRFQFFGTFLAYPKRVSSLFAKLTEAFKRAEVAPEVYFKKKEQLEKYLQKHDTKK